MNPWVMFPPAPYYNSRPPPRMTFPPFPRLPGPGPFLPRPGPYNFNPMQMPTANYRFDCPWPQNNQTNYINSSSIPPLIQNVPKRYIPEQHFDQILEELLVPAKTLSGYHKKAKMVELGCIYPNLLTRAKDEFLTRLLRTRIVKGARKGELVMWTIILVWKEIDFTGYISNKKNATLFFNYYERLLESKGPSMDNFKEMTSIRYHLGRMMTGYGKMWEELDNFAENHFKRLGCNFKSVSRSANCSFEAFSHLKDKEEYKIPEIPEKHIFPKPKSKSSKKTKSKPTPKFTNASAKYTNILPKFSSTKKPKEPVIKPIESKKPIEKSKTSRFTSTYTEDRKKDVKRNCVPEADKTLQIKTTNTQAQSADWFDGPSLMKKFDEHWTKLLDDVPFDFYLTESNLWSTALFRLISFVQKSDKKMLHSFALQILSEPRRMFMKNNPKKVIMALVAFVEILSIPSFSTTELPEATHDFFQKLVTELYDGVQECQHFLNKLRYQYTSLGFPWKLHYSMETDAIDEEFYAKVVKFRKLKVNIKNFNQIKDNLLELPQNDYISQWKRMAQLLFIYRNVPSNNLLEYLNQIFVFETNVKEESDKLRLWLLVECLNFRKSRMYANLEKFWGEIIDLFRNLLTDNLTTSKRNELISIRQELGLKLPKYNFEKIDRFAKTKFFGWSAELSSRLRKPSIYLHIKLDSDQEEQIENIRLMLNCAINREFRKPVKSSTKSDDSKNQVATSTGEEFQIISNEKPRETNATKSHSSITDKNTTKEDITGQLTETDLDNLNNVPVCKNNWEHLVAASSPKASKSYTSKILTDTVNTSNQVNKRRTEGFLDEPTTKKKTLQEMEPIKQRIIVGGGLSHRDPTQSHTSGSGESSNTWLTSIIPSKDCIIPELPENVQMTSKSMFEIVESQSENPIRGKMFEAIKKKILHTQKSSAWSSAHLASTTIVGDTMEVILRDDFTNDEYMDQILSPSFIEQRVKLINGKVVMVLIHNLKYNENKNKL